MDNKAFEKISYGLFVITTNLNGKDNGCIINTVNQVSLTPTRIAVSISKANFTHDMILTSKKFCVSVLDTNSNFEIFKHFGFKSGRDTDKFEGYNKVLRTENGCLAVTENTNAYICANVLYSLDLDSHTLFIADVTDAVALTDAPSLTYSDYHKNVKPKPQESSANGKTFWRCKICGYEYEGEELPADFICPLCKHPASDFEKI